MKFKNSILICLVFAAIALVGTSCNTNKAVTTSSPTSTATSSTSTARQGQNRGDRQRPQRGDRQAQMEALYSKLQLSDQQKAQMEVIQNKYSQEMEQNRPSRGGDRTAMREKMQSIRDRQNTEIKGVLTDSQYNIYEQEMKAMQPERGGRGGRSRG